VDSRRLESFSDGVFAVAITVLVFNLLTIGAKGPGLSFRLLLGDAWPQYFAYVVGFLSIGIMWLNHHTLVLHVAAVDRATLVLNIFLLMTVVAVPFPTALVAEHLRNSGAADAVVSYGVVMILLGVGILSLRHASVDSDVPMLILGTMILMPGIGFIISAGITWFLAQRLGLMPTNDADSSPNLTRRP